MGATFYEHDAGPHEDPAGALREIQAREIARRDLAAELAERLDDMRDAVRACEEDDEYNLLDFYRGEVRKLERLTARGVPADVGGRIDLLRAIHDSNAEEVGGILDVSRVAAAGWEFDGSEIFVAGPLTDAQTAAACGSARPTAAEARSSQVDSFLNERLHRAECVCFRFYEEDRATPAGWRFVGNTAD